MDTVCWFVKLYCCSIILIQLFTEDSIDRGTCNGWSHFYWPLCWETAGGSVAQWLACWTQAQKAWVQLWRCRVTVLGKLFTPIVLVFTKQQNW